MPEPTIIKIRKLGQDKRRTVEKSEKRLRAALRRLQTRINAFLTNEVINGFKLDKEGKILSGSNNSKRLQGVERLQRYVNNEIDKEIRKVLNTEFTRIKNANDKYFKEFEPNQKIKTRVNKLHRKLIAQFKRRVVSRINLSTKIGVILAKGIRDEATPSELKQDVRAFIEGKDQLGALEHFFWKEDGLEQFQVHARSIAESYSKSLELDYAIYAGGEIKTTRDFCDERNGNVYTRKEIAEWNNLEWPGKKKDNNIFIDCGGYNCRHELDWISKQLAVRLRPELADD